MFCDQRKGVIAMNKLDLKIDESVLNRTFNCKDDFRCLIGNKEFTCEVVRPVGSSMVQIKVLSQTSCKYHVPFGSSAYCICPTRNELYNRYKI